MAWRLAQEVSSGDPTASAGNWLVYVRGDTVHVIDAKKGKEAWKSSGLGGDIWVGKKAIVEVPKNDPGRVTAYDIRNGDPIWNHLPGVRGERAESTVGAVTADTLVLGYDTTPESRPHYEVSGYDLRSGKRKWHRSVASEVDALKLNTTTPRLDYDRPLEQPHLWAMTDSTVVYASDEYGDISGKKTFAIDTSTGKTRWHLPKGITQVDDASLRTISGGRILAIGDDDIDECAGVKLAVAEPANDSVRTFRTGERHESDDYVPCASGKEFPLDGHAVLAQSGQQHPQIIDLNTGKPTWTAKKRGMPLGLHGHVAVAYADNDMGDDVITAVDTRTNKKLWTIVDDGSAYDRGGDVVDGGTYLSTQKSDTTAYDIDSGKKRWHLQGDLVAVTDKYFVVSHWQSKQLMAVKRERS